MLAPVSGWKTIIAPDAPLESDEIVLPGEYESKSIEIRGFGLLGDSTDKYLKTAYLVLWEDMRFVFLGHAASFPSDDIMEELAEPDVLFVPVGDHFFSGEDAAIPDDEFALAVADIFE